VSAAGSVGRTLAPPTIFKLPVSVGHLLMKLGIRALEGMTDSHHHIA
jgi:hypothetical protein